MDISVRVEKDFLGEMELEAGALYGIHSMRAVQNFPGQVPVFQEWYRAMGSVKKACYLTIQSFAKAVRDQYDIHSLPISLPGEDILQAMIGAAAEVESGMHAAHFIVPAFQGGAGTSINLNVNEIITNRSLQKMGFAPGRYDLIDPVEQANLFQSTNDVVPTALRVATMRLLVELETAINKLRQSFEEKEKTHRHALRVAYTQMQEAVPSSFGRLFSTYCDALSRDWWRVSRCAERIRVVNLGGSATGSGITVPVYFIREAVQQLQQVTGLPVSRAENLSDATANLDPLVEVHAIMKSHAVNLEKIAADLRLLASDIAGSHNLSIPQRQLGSSIMPGKVNPVIAEFVIGNSHRVYANDQLITTLCAQGCLELNAYLPAIGHALIESLKLLVASDNSLKASLVEGLTINREASHNNLLNSSAVATALLPYIGYNQAALLAREMKANGINLIEANHRLGLMEEDQLLQALEPEKLLKEGFHIHDIMPENGKGT